VRGALLLIYESHHSREFPGTIRLPLDDPQHLAVNYLCFWRFFVGKVTPFKSPVASDLQILNFRSVTGAQAFAGVCSRLSVA
jgi:hypothetical protein